MLSVRGFAGGRDAARFSGFAVDVIAVINTAVIPAASRHDESNVELRTFVIGGLLKGDSTNGTASRPTGNA